MTVYKIQLFNVSRPTLSHSDRKYLSNYTELNKILKSIKI